jgi:hypothetical protein
MDVGKKCLDLSLGVEGVLDFVGLEFFSVSETCFGDQLWSVEFELGSEGRRLVQFDYASQGDHVLHSCLVIQVVFFV